MSVLRKHPVDVELVVLAARAGCFDPPRLVPDDHGVMKPISSAEWLRRKAEIADRAEQYARWRVAAFESGECSNPW